VLQPDRTMQLFHHLVAQLAASECRQMTPMLYFRQAAEGSVTVPMCSGGPTRWCGRSRAPTPAALRCRCWRSPTLATPGQTSASSAIAPTSGRPAASSRQLLPASGGPATRTTPGCRRRRRRCAGRAIRARTRSAAPALGGWRTATSRRSSTCRRSSGGSCRHSAAATTARPNISRRRLLGQG